MGLDMYLMGEKFFHEGRKKSEGFEVAKKILDLGYWRKHPNLHGYIVQEFAEGVDECQEIELNRNAILKILDAIDNKSLPDTEGFFFGETEGTEAEHDTQVFTAALEWLNREIPGVWKSITYRASW